MKSNRLLLILFLMINFYFGSSHSHHKSHEESTKKLSKIQKQIKKINKLYDEFDEEVYSSRNQNSFDDEEEQDSESSTEEDETAKTQEESKFDAPMFRFRYKNKKSVKLPSPNYQIRRPNNLKPANYQLKKELSFNKKTVPSKIFLTRSQDFKNVHRMVKFKQLPLIKNKEIDHLSQKFEKLNPILNETNKLIPKSNEKIQPAYLHVLRNSNNGTEVFQVKVNVRNKYEKLPLESEEDLKVLERDLLTAKSELNDSISNYFLDPTRDTKLERVNKIESRINFLKEKQNTTLQDPEEERIMREYKSPIIISPEILNNIISKNRHYEIEVPKKKADFRFKQRKLLNNTLLRINVNSTFKQSHNISGIPSIKNSTKTSFSIAMNRTNTSLSKPLILHPLSIKDNTTLYSNSSHFIHLRNNSDNLRKSSTKVGIILKNCTLGSNNTKITALKKKLNKIYTKFHHILQNSKLEKGDLENKIHQEMKKSEDRINHLSEKYKNNFSIRKNAYHKIQTTENISEHSLKPASIEHSRNLGRKDIERNDEIAVLIDKYMRVSKGR